MTDSPILIVGTQRSGTTLLGQILTAHSRLYILNEFYAIYPILAASRPDRDAFFAEVENHLKLKAEDFAPADAQNLSLVELFHRAMQCVAQREGKQRWGIKDPGLNPWLNQAVTWFPQAKWVMIYRDPRAVCASYLKRKWNVANTYHGACLWRDQVQAEEALANQQGENAYELRYEDLLSDSHKALEEVCQLLGESYEERMLEFYSQKPDFELHAGNVNVQKPLDPSQAHKWRKQLTPYQIGMIETITSQQMARHGYQAEAKPVTVGLLRRKFYHLHQSVMTTYWWQRRTQFYGVKKRLASLLPPPLRPTVKQPAELVDIN